MKQHLWKDDAACLGLEVNIFFDKYEEAIESRHIVDSVCKACPMISKCFAVGVSGKEWGIWGSQFLVFWPLGFLCSENYFTAWPSCRLSMDFQWLLAKSGFYLIPRHLAALTL